ncbi:membrane protein [Obesumbacterium proteus]|uniref:homoserine/threonine efflux transporter n=1 Tax=Obesumbacterium proteus TaxID=82983 RepID=UPI000622999A|nr:homoserine/threonine efflux transporter [Obesumbacterium proteus]KKI48176.1 membrane protein [Obesumbacterium proteus]
MEPLHAVWVTVGLFVLTFFNPGANLFVVVQTSLSSGRRAGVHTGLGVALGDAIYSGLGLFGMVALMTQFESLFSIIKIAGGVYLLWYAYGVVKNQNDIQIGTLHTLVPGEGAVFFRRGLITDLSNPQTVLFFISIFSVTLSAETPTWAKLLTWFGIVMSSVIWRIFLSQAFSLSVVRRGYSRIQRVISKVIGAVVGAFALRLIYEGGRELSR